jgi:hypothetical protein
MPKPKKTYRITCERGRRTTMSSSGTVEQLVTYHSYTLECGDSYSHEKGNKKINRNPKSIESLVKNLNNATNNSAANGYSGIHYSYDELTDPVNPV